MNMTYKELVNIHELDLEEYFVNRGLNSADTPEKIEAILRGTVGGANTVEDMDTKKQNFWNTFGTTLENALTIFEGDYMSVVQGVIIDSVTKDIMQRIGDSPLQTDLYFEDPIVKVEVRGDILRFKVEGSGYIEKGRGNFSTRAIRGLNEMLVDESQISLDSVDQLYINRPGNIEINPLRETVQLSGKAIDTSHNFKVTYFTDLSIEDILQVYKQHMPAMR